jgi:hypothetical protein
VQSGILAAHLKLHQDVTKDRPPIEEQIILKNNTDICVGAGYGSAADGNGPARGCGEASNERKQCTLTAAAWTKKRDEFRSTNVEIDVVDRFSWRAVAGWKGFADPFKPDERNTGAPHLSCRGQLNRSIFRHQRVNPMVLGKTLLNGRNRLHFDKKSFVHKPVDHQQSIRRKFSVWKHFRKFTQTVLHEVRNRLGVNEIGGELHDVAPSSPGRLQRGFQIVEDLPALRIEIPIADYLAVLVGRKHAGNEEIFRRFDARHMVILAEGLTERFTL